MDKLNAMRAFVEIVDRGSLTAAGASLGRSSPTMVRLLAALEADLGATLLRRTTRRMSLTPEGAEYLERCRQILADVAEAESLVGEGSVEPRGRLVVSAPVQFGEMHVTRAAAAFAARFPAVEIDLRLHDRVVDLVEEGIDAAVRIGPLPDSTLIASRVGTIRRVVVASPAFLERVGVPAHPEALARASCVRFHGTGSMTGWSFREGEREIRVEIGGNFSTNQTGAARAACEAGVGFGAFLHYQVARSLAAGRLCEVLADFEPAALPLSLVYPEARRRTARLRAFLDWVRPRLVESAGL